MWDDTGTFLVALIYIAILYVLVNPSSPGPAAITAVTGALGNVISAATGGGSLTSTTTPAASTPASATSGNQVA